jgi:hypothetical protein
MAYWLRGLVALTAAATSCAQTAASSQPLRFGRLVLQPDAAAVEISRSGRWFTIADPDRRDREPITLEVTVSKDAPCSTASMASELPERARARAGLSTTVLASGLVLNAATGDRGCRNLAGSVYVACVRHDGETTVFDALGAGCATPIYNESRAAVVLSSLRPIE